MRLLPWEEGEELLIGWGKFECLTGVAHCTWGVEGSWDMLLGDLGEKEGAGECWGEYFWGF